MIKQYIASNIKWDADDEVINQLPSNMMVEVDVENAELSEDELEDIVNDISDTWGWCINGCDIVEAHDFKGEGEVVGIMGLPVIVNMPERVAENA